MTDKAYLIRAFRAGDAAAFASLNRRWIEELFGMEEEDRRVLETPEEAIIAPGGYIAIADIDGETVGTGALMMSDEHPEMLELVKMATDPKAQGKGIGSAVMDHLIAVAKERGAKQIWLETNDKLSAATALYKRKGFRTLAADDLHPTPYSRCNLQMVLDLN
ncbi:MAG: GNAT family N-acetyltransferase [Pseudomonadota bacterium]